MGSTFYSLHYHVIFSTKDRKPAIRVEWRERLHAYLGGIVRNQGGTAEAVGGVEDHVHLLIGLTPSLRLSDVMREVKKDATRWVLENFIPDFAWQDGYAAFSVSASNITAVRDYIARQEEHHRKTTFAEELVQFLDKHGVTYDPKYLV